MCAAAMLNGPSVNLKTPKGRFTFQTWSVYDWGLHLRFQRFDGAVLETFSTSQGELSTSQSEVPDM